MLLTASRDTSSPGPYLSCDRCGAVFRPPWPTGDPATVLAVAATRGWREEHLGGVPWHRCPACGPVAGAGAA
ncbi:hypothetical protein ABZS66_04960 [Dactylosporangium sp. NPDC005572]|uniref:hypothetical protein n=1 Tax=Dactylosporangium sp. NPDC005572 TaxID=3156889 RepID=UPI0033A81DD7